MKRIAILLGASALVLGLIIVNRPSDTTAPDSTTAVQDLTEPVFTPVTVPEGMEVATFAAGCFWCTEAVFQETEGVGDVISGYAGGQEVSPTYEQVYTNSTGHREAVQFFYDPNKITYSEILDILWQAIDPTDDGGQFVDRGFSYTAAVFYHNDTQKSATEQSIAALEASDRFDKPVVTRVLPFTTFYQAENYHQDFYKKSSERYDQYEQNSGREQYKAAIWQDIQNQQSN